MVQLLKVREQIFRFVGRFEIFVMAGIRFVIAYVAFHLINSATGYMKTLTDYPIALILALLCSFLPAGLMMFFGAVLILLQFYALSRELCLITALVFIILFCVYLRFSTRKGLYTVLTPILGTIGIPYVMPVVGGLLSEVYAVISVICGEVVYFVLKHVSENSAMFAPTNQTSTKSIITFAATQILMDREMYLYLAAFAAAAIVVYCIRSLPADFSHLIAVVAGIVVQLIIICAGEIYFGNQGSVSKVIAGCLISLLIALAVQFMTRSLDYSRVEQVQFEDDEYYYYVKAIPKATVSMQDKQVKQIHAKRDRGRRLSEEAREMPEKSAGSAQEDSLEEQVMKEFRGNA